jgi:hypothetical protein
MVLRLDGTAYLSGVSWKHASGVGIPWRVHSHGTARRLAAAASRALFSASAGANLGLAGCGCVPARAKGKIGSSLRIHGVRFLRVDVKDSEAVGARVRARENVERAGESVSGSFNFNIVTLCHCVKVIGLRVPAAS